MDWTELIIQIDAENIDAAADIANMAVPYGIYIEDYRTLEQETREIANIDLIDEELLSKDRTKGFIHIYIEKSENPREAVSFLTERLNNAGIGNEITLKSCKNEDWENNWKEFFKPLNVGKGLLIRPLWTEDCPNPENRKVLSIEPGLAFGTGGHNTTRLCLEMCEKYIKPGARVLDAGCGSGILGIAALLFGAKSVVGVDIDELAVKTARENGAQNGFAEPVYKIIHGDLVDKVTGVFDVVVANIVADVVIELSSSVGSFMKSDSLFIISGIISARENDVKAALAKNGFITIEENKSADWLCFVCGKGAMAK